MKKFLFLLFCISKNILFANGNLNLKTSDNCNISANSKIFSTNTIVLLEVHGLGSNKEEWNKFNSFLEKEKISWLSIDLRGHGKSTKCKNKQVNYKSFTQSDWLNIVKDIETAYNYLKRKFKPENIILIGASLGANSIFSYAKNIKAQKIVLLSPGLNYAGFKPLDDFPKINSEVLIVSSLSDTYSYYSCQVFEDYCQKNEKKCFFLNPPSGHGVQIFDLPDGDIYAQKIINWIKNKN